MKIGKRGVLNRSCKFCYLGKHASIKNHDFSPKLLKLMTIQVSDSDSGLFRFIHDCGHPVVTSEPQFKRKYFTEQRIKISWDQKTDSCNTSVHFIHDKKYLSLLLGKKYDENLTWYTIRIQIVMYWKGYTK